MSTAANLKTCVFPRWLKELDRFLPLKSQFYLYGNVYDSFYYPVNYSSAQSEEELDWRRMKDVRTLLTHYLQAEGYELVCYYDQLDKFEVKATQQGFTAEQLIPFLTQESERAGELLSHTKGLESLGEIDKALNVFRALAGNRQRLAAGIINYASRFAARPNELEEKERRCFLKLLKTAQEAALFPATEGEPPQRGGKRNVLIVLCDKLNDIPPWLLLDNPLTKGIEVARPAKEERARFFRSQASRFHCEGEAVKTEALTEVLPALTEGFTNEELMSLTALSRRESIHVNRTQVLVDLYRYGEKESFWEKLAPRAFEEAESRLKGRVLGQEAAIKKSLDVIRRAKLGLNGIELKKGSRPKGVLFFLGPTGTGKTELARALAELVFNDEDAVIRFDMSEYNEPHSGEKLIGAPPGYVGYDQGGQLTRAMRSRPFSVVLFDEMEKAHPIIFDKFLQILDAGRLTDGKGETVYFTEALIIFTSNLGVDRLDVHEDDDYKKVADKLLGEVKGFFTKKLGRPEILNRFGENFVVFDFIRPPTATRVLKKVLDNMTGNLNEHKGCVLEYDEGFVDAFQRHFLADNIINGGRGINNRVEEHITNGLANFLFGLGRVRGAKVHMSVEAGEGPCPAKVAFRSL